MFNGNKLGWVWGEKKLSAQSMNFTARQREGSEMQQKVRLSLELDVDFLPQIDIVETLINAHLTFDVPKGVDIQDVRLTHLDLLEYIKRVD